MIKIVERKECRHIHITRGDFAALAVSVLDKDGNRIPCDGQDVAVKIQVRKPPGNGTAVLFDGDIAYTEDNVPVWVIHPDDTRRAECENYVYDVQVQMGEDIVFTIIPLSDFVLMTESTEKGGVIDGDGIKRHP